MASPPATKEDRYLARWLDEKQIAERQGEALKAFKNQDAIDAFVIREEEKARKELERARRDEDKKAEHDAEERLAAVKEGERETEKADELHGKALGAFYKEEREEEEKKKRDLEAARKAREEARKTAVGQIKTTVVDMVDGASEKVGNVAARIAGLQTPGGIGLLLAILTVLVFTVVQVNGQGDTRLKQLWYMLNGRAQLLGRVTPTPQGPATPSNVAGDLLAIGTAGQDIANQEVAALSAGLAVAITPSAVAQVPGIITGVEQGIAAVLNPVGAVGQLYNTFRGQIGG